MIDLRRYGPAWFVSTAVLAAAAAAEPRIVAVVVALLLGAAVWRFSDASLAVAAFAVLAVRPSLDIFSERRLGLGPFATNPAVIFGVAILFVALVLALRRARDGHVVWPGRRLLRAHLWLLLAYGIALASGWRWYGTYGASVGVRDAARMMSVLSAFLVVVWWVGARRERCRLGWVLLVAGAMVPIAAALWQLATGRGNTDIASLNRLQGTFSHPNTFGPFLVPFILLSIAGLRNASRAARFLRVGVAAGLSLLVVLTYSRTAVLVLITGMIALPMLQAGRFGVRAIISSTTVALVFATVGWLLVGDIVRERFSDLRVGTEALEAARTGEAENSLEWRLLNWGVLVTLGREHPLAGHGAGMTTELNPIVNAETGLPYNAHNDFVRFFVEGGGLGLLAYLIYGLLLARWTLLTARTAGAREAASAYAVAAALLALFFLTLGTPEFGQQTALQYELYGMLALMTAIRGGEREASLAKAGSLSGVEPEFGPMRRLASQHESSPGDHQPDSETDGNRK